MKLEDIEKLKKQNEYYEEIIKLLAEKEVEITYLKNRISKLERILKRNNIT